MNATTTTRAWGLLLAMVIALSTVIAVPAAAQADSRFTVAWTGIGIYPRSAPDMAASKVGKALADGASVSVNCELTGTSVTSDAGTSTIWERLSDGTYLPNVFVETGANGWTPGVPRCDAVESNPAPAPSQKYNREAAAEYARNNFAGEYVAVINNCTVFVSAALQAGGFQTTKKWQPSSSKWSDQGSRELFLRNGGSGPTKRWASADHLKNFLASENDYGTLTEVSLDSKNPGVELGDIVLYDWAGKTPGVIDHVAIVTGFQVDGTALVTQKESSQLDRVWNWSASAQMPFAQSNPGTRVYVIHITY